MFTSIQPIRKLLVLMYLFGWAFIGCQSKPDPEPDYVSALVGTYKVKKWVFNWKTYSDTTYAPYVAGRIFVERAATDDKKIGIDSFLKQIDKSTPITDSDLENDFLYQTAHFNPQKNLFTVNSKNGIITFANSFASGTYTKDTLIYIYTTPGDPPAQYIITAVK
ncbi:hypothetical protein GO755_30500 [Spirosoma sp. HMF4905]|uniref:Uncharacterized protein n=1 Tax=Spirosoma arboris TaxID=2682092 RepID=A0A7K1SKR3_9BACT|nr:hypothetical protein [Spirosoma arboris]MVM34402.1 hypothetical protein [Spirosoma arboris]